MDATSVKALRQSLTSFRDRLEEAFRPDSAAQGFPGVSPSTGHCAAVAVIVHELVGGDIISTLVDGTSHWLNRLNAGGRCMDVDLTGDQFSRPRVQVKEAGKLYPETRIRTQAELTEETLERARLLATRAGFTETAQAIEMQLENRSGQSKGR